MSDATEETSSLSLLQIRHMSAEVNVFFYMLAGIKPDLKHHHTPARWLSMWMKGGSEVRSNLKL